MSKLCWLPGLKEVSGTSVTKAFLASGAFVAGSSRGIAQTDFPHPRFLAVPADLLDPAQAAHLAETVLARCGRIDALVHLAGGFTGGALHETSDAVWDEMMNVEPARRIPHLSRGDPGDAKSGPRPNRRDR